MTKKQKAESALLLELQRDHGYMLLQARPADRFTTSMRRQGKVLKMAPAVSMRLVVPEGSALGKTMAEVYRSLIGKDKKKR